MCRHCALSPQVVCYCCDRQTFRELFGSLQDILDDEAERRDAEAKAPPPPSWHSLTFGDVLGSGSFGVVTLATEASTGLKYALKSIRKSEVLAQGQQAALLNEKRILSSLKHPFIVRLYNVSAHLMHAVVGATSLRRAARLPCPSQTHIACPQITRPRAITVSQ